MEKYIVLAGVIVVAVMAAILSYALSFLSARWAKRLGAVDEPTGGRKIHTKPIPLFGGVGIALTILLSTLLLSTNGLLPGIRFQQLIGFGLGVIILLVGGATDDRKSRQPALQIIFPILAALIVIISGTGIIQITDPTKVGGYSLVWWQSPCSLLTAHCSLSLPADLITFAWLLFATYATKLLDGLDGLVTGLAVIGSTMVGALTLSTAFFQPGVTMLTAGVGGPFLGFLPRNLHPAKQFLGEVGSTLAGFTLGFLAIVSGAKVAIALAVLAIPLADAGLVVLRRLRSGASPWKGDASHLHFRLLQAGIPHRSAVSLYWAVAFAAGVIALGLQTRGKVYLIAALITLTFISSWLVSRKKPKSPNIAG